MKMVRFAIGAVALWAFVSATIFASAQNIIGGHVYGDVKVTSGGGCSPATAFLARTSGLTGTETTAITNFMCGMVTDGLFTNTSSGYCTTNFDVIYIFAVTGSSNALLNMCSASFNGTANGTPTFTNDAGFTGVDASSTVYIDTGFNPSTAGGNFSTNSAHISVWSLTNAASSVSGGSAIGNSAGNLASNFSAINPKYNDGNAYFRIVDGTPSAGVANANSTGHYVANRTGASASQGYINGSLVLSPNATAGSLVNKNIVVLAINDVVGGVSSGGGYQIAAASIGAGLTGTKVSNFCHRLNTYLNAVGAASSGIC